MCSRKGSKYQPVNWRGCRKLKTLDFDWVETLLVDGLGMQTEDREEDWHLEQKNRNVVIKKLKITSHSLR